MLRVARFLHGFTRHPIASVHTEETKIRLDAGSVPATVMRPGAPGSHPGWIVLHGITVPGRQHPTLVRFAHALARAGGTVVIPEVPAWRELRIDPAVADATIAAAVEHLRQRDDVEESGFRLVGFSFGATQALITAARPELSEAIGTVVGFGGYCDLRRTLRFMMTGEHEWEGRRYRLEPDPYGRWIIAANYLLEVPEYREMRGLADALRELALYSGGLGVNAADPIYDGKKAELRRPLAPEEREIWDLLAHPSGTRPPDAAAAALADRLYEAGLRRHPSLDPAPSLARLRQRLVLAHGHDDRLMPYTELLRLRAALPTRLRVHATVTRLFAHSREADPLRPWEYPGEAFRYLRLLSRALAAR
jgi:pimeloyl-ACP methyl ester carboxylesterase